MGAKIIKKVSGVFILIAFLVTGCTHMIKTDMDTYLQNQEEYKRKKIVFTTDLEDLVDRYELYRGREVELTAPITYFGKEDFSTWYLILARDEKQIRAYEDNYHNYIHPDALQLLTWAKSEGGEVTVRGKLKEMGIELNQLTYNEYFVHTNRRPYRYRSCYRPYYRSYDGYYDSWTNWNYNPSYNY
jgi:hypothetical protein